MTRIAKITMACLLLVAGTGWAVQEDAYDIQGPGGAAFLEDFDGMGAFGRFAPGASFFTTYWSVIGNGVETAQGLDNAEGTGAGGDDWGTRPNGYNSAGFAGDEDRNLAIAATARGESRMMEAVFQNNSGQTMTEITMSFDHEIHWSRFLPDGSDPSAGDSGLRVAEMPVYIQPTQIGYGPGVITSVLDNSEATVSKEWIDDAQAEAENLLRRGVGGVFDLPEPVAPGETFKIRFHRNYGTAYSNGKNLNNGIDNLRIVYRESYGDANVDGIVDVGDLGILAANWQLGSDPNDRMPTWGKADFNLDGVVDVGDLGILAANWSDNVYELPAAVPEPTTMSLLALAGLAAVRRKR
jgi:hypothetical protein